MRHMGVVAMVVLGAPMLGAPDALAVERTGFVIGIGAGVGQSRIEGESNTALGTDFHIGGMLGYKTALLLEGYAVTDSEEGVTLSLGVSTLAVQRWVSDKVWVKAGVGSGFVFVSGDGESASERYGLGLLGAAGYELVQRQKFTLDLQGRFSTMSREGVRVNNVGANIGFNWW